MKNRQSRAGFTLIELLTVIAVVAVLAAIIFPVYSTVRGKARQTVCLSNMRQIGDAIAMYAEDADDYYPNGADPSDLYTPIWDTIPYASKVKQLPLLQIILSPYINSPNVWQCPSDTGFTTLDMTYAASEPNGVYLNAKPTMFQAFGTSYLYRTELALKHKLVTEGCTSPTSPPMDYGPSDINVLMDGNGGWHGTETPQTWVDERRYNMLMGDGHVENVSGSQLIQTWSYTLD